ncbi:hypothetical protein [Bifidobacterium panos]|uniref:TetR family transcriptional regulator n=1 Tax=Bifidobacterium panos TaxID=2675321 RepID=A0ABX1T004_9BIFI|nr:hypothetical protein [Bifidobacterium sp. DSM 109963]NMN02747.1 hypothetical protein [Bifidobacterium sp. DSM 109963]
MSVASREAEERYPRLVHEGTDCYRQVYDSRDLQEAYERGRTAPLADEEIEAAAVMLFGLFSDAEYRFDEVSGRERARYRAYAQIVLDSARKAVEK